MILDFGLGFFYCFQVFVFGFKFLFYILGSESEFVKGTKEIFGAIELFEILPTGK